MVDIGVVELIPAGDGPPITLSEEGKRLRVVAVRERWRIDDEWWRDPISREYYALVLEDGRPVILFRDLVAEGGTGSEGSPHPTHAAQEEPSPRAS